MLVHLQITSKLERGLGIVWERRGRHVDTTNRGDESSKAGQETAHKTTNRKHNVRNQTKDDPFRSRVFKIQASKTAPRLDEEKQEISAASSQKYQLRMRLIRDAKRELKKALEEGEKYEKLPITLFGGDWKDEIVNSGVLCGKEFSPVRRLKC